MVAREVRKLLLEKLQVTQPALSKRAKRMKSSYGPMSTDEAVYVIAHQEGIDLSRYLSIQVIDKVRSLVPKELPQPSVSKSLRVLKVKQRKLIAKSSYPLVKKSMIAHGVAIGAESFPQVFVLENSIRNLIITKLKKVHGVNWWNKAKIRNVRDEVQRVLDKEKGYPHREKRGLHPIFYSNFAHLKQIILNERNNFTDIIIDFKWFEVEMDQVYMARNSLAHSILISNDDAARIRLFYRDWSRLLENAGMK